MPLLPAWLQPLMPQASAAQASRHVGLLSAAYSAGVLLGAPLWGALSDRIGRYRILIAGLVGYVASLLPLLRPEWTGLAGIYSLRAATGFFVAAVVPVVPALVAESATERQRARRFAWLGAMSLLGFLFGPVLNVLAEQVSKGAAAAGLPTWDTVDIVVVLSTVLGASIMLALAVRLLERREFASIPRTTVTRAEERVRVIALWALNGVVMFALAGFELGIVLQGQQHAGVSSREISLMFAECSLAMLAVNAVLFFTGLLERSAGRGIIASGLAVAVAGLAMLSQHGSGAWMYVGVSLTAAGTGLVLPTVSYLSAGASRHRLGTTMGGLAAAAGVGQTLGATVGGWLFGATARLGFAWLALGLLATVGILLVRPGWWVLERTSLTARDSSPLANEQHGRER